MPEDWFQCVAPAALLLSKMPASAWSCSHNHIASCAIEHYFFGISWNSQKFAARLHRLTVLDQFLKTATHVGILSAMKERSIRLGPREQQITELLLQGCDNSEIAGQLQMARRTVKAHFNRLFMRFGITGGIKRVKLATMLYRRQICSEQSVLESEQRVIELVAQGLKNREVAQQIGTTEHVVKNYLRIIYDKLGLWNRVELALWYEARRHESLAHA